jgi:DNA-binding protein HU-beta
MCEFFLYKRLIMVLQYNILTKKTENTCKHCYFSTFLSVKKLLYSNKPLILTHVSIFSSKTIEMNKGDLINKIAESAKITKAQASEALNAVLDGVADALKSGDKVTLIGFGTFSVSTREARTGRNPQTGASIKIEAKNVVKFKPGKELSDSVN